jgi:hypothetical protein
MVDRPSGARPYLKPAMAASARTRGGTPAPLTYANGGARPCRQCSRPIPAPEPGTRGRRPRYCGYCRQVREALRFARAAVRRLEAITDPDVAEAAR